MPSPSSVPPQHRPFDFVIVGAQKAGSTTLATLLSQHPDVTVPEEEVPYFEDPFYDNSDPSELSRLRAVHPAAALLGIRRPDYLTDPNVPKRIKRTLRGAKILAVVRNPLSRFVSAWAWLVRVGALEYTDLNRAVSRSVYDYRRGVDSPWSSLISNGLYGAALAHWGEVFSPTDIRVLRTADLDDKNLLDRTCAWLGAGSFDGFERVVENTNTYSSMRLRWLNLTSPLRFNWRQHEVYRFGASKAFTPRKALAMACIAVDRYALAFVSDGEAPTLSTSSKRTLAAIFAPDLERLESSFGVSVALE